MNKARREAISKLIDMIDEIRSDVAGLRDEEQDYFDNMPESLQGGDKGQAAEEAISALEDAYNSLDEVFNYLSSAGSI